MKGNTKEQSKPLKGIWLRHDDDETNAWECSICHNIWQLMDGTPTENHMHYCSYCGAKMSTNTNHLRRGVNASKQR